MPLTRTCRISGKEFVITDRELSFLESISPIFHEKKYVLPPPTLSPEERMRRRLSWRNSFSLYKGKCIISGKDIISCYNPKWPYKSTDQSIWWTEVEWLNYGKRMNLDIPFFDQYDELIKATPLPSLSNSYDININSEYVNGTINVKDCYLVFNTSNTENSQYSETINRSDQIFDCSYVFESSHCYESIGITRCHNSIWLEECEDCTDSYFLYDCHGCHHCILCDSLENQSYCIRNKKVSLEEYEYFIKNNLESHGAIDMSQGLTELRSIKNTLPPKNHIIGSEDCDGRFIKFSKNVVNGKNLTGVEDTMNTWQMNYAIRCYDCFSWGWGSAGSPGAENCYECHGIGSSAYGLVGCWGVWENTRNMYYCYSCIGCQDCLGCVWLRNKSYCIMNVQYTKEEYDFLAPQIIEKMIADGEWGEYPPSSMSTNSYNESYAMMEYPLSESEAKQRGYKWYPDDMSIGFTPSKIIPASRIPENIEDIPDDILSWAIECEVSGKYFKITRPELDFYRKHLLPIPKKHYDMRRKERFERRFR
jgi:hypothetical protein